ncbi:putative hydroxybutyrate dehydrogenase [Massariosphaeria phaeospora]|uniref:Putative hydroxybutyrate dehydrogenase n=1 Tax=Massariosphaeria phaeospora TaxID=100035 RepID=A0A7C8I6G8_9PLEO|nr:putative hydroxybutyrate dehydrogenase [Massariosphaeria phaeospora]
MPQLTWLVTGCSSGIGETFVQRILARGDKVVATTRGDVSRIAALADAGAKTYSLDVTATESEIKGIVAKILEGGPIDVIVNNAGYIEAGLAEETSYDHYQAQFATNFFGVVKTTQAVLPHFRENKSGTVVFIGSSGGIGGEPGAGPYCSTKFALEGFHDCMKQEVAHLNIKSVIFELGFFRTKIMHPDNVLKFRSEPIADYDGIRDLTSQFVDGINGNQPGDPKKAVEIMIDVVKGEGVAAGKEMPDRLPLGPDCLATMRKRCVGNLTTCNEWEDVIRSTNVEG